MNINNLTWTSIDILYKNIILILIQILNILNILNGNNTETVYLKRGLNQQRNQVFENRSNCIPKS